MFVFYYLYVVVLHKHDPTNLCYLFVLVKTNKNYNVYKYCFRSLSSWTWILGTAYRMWYGVISVESQSPLCTVTFVISICVKNANARKRIFQVNLQNTNYCLSNYGAVSSNVKIIPQKCAIVTVNNATFLFVNGVHLQNTKAINPWTWWQNLKAKKNLTNWITRIRKFYLS